MNLKLWNNVAILKLLWDIDQKKDCLWIRWVNAYYIKNESLEICPIPLNATWVVRKVIESRKYLESLVQPEDLGSKLNSVVENGQFSIKKMYNSLMPLFSRVTWKSIALQHNIHPRHKFLVWLAAWRRLATFERLQKFGIQVSPACAFCAAPIETFDHLYFECPMTRALWSRLLLWLGLSRTIGSWQQELEWANA